MEAEAKDKQGNPIGHRFDCATCTDEDKIGRGCDGGVKYQLGDMTIDGCPEKLVDSDTMHNIGLWKRFKMYNSFPFSGGWAEMPAAFIFLIERLEVEYNKFVEMMHGS